MIRQNLLLELTSCALEPQIAARLRETQETLSAKAERIETNRQIAKTRVRVEYGFATIKHNMVCGLHRGIGLARAQSEIGLMCLVYIARLSLLTVNWQQNKRWRPDSTWTALKRLFPLDLTRHSLYFC